MFDLLWLAWVGYLSQASEQGGPLGAKYTRLLGDCLGARLALFFDTLQWAAPVRRARCARSGQPRVLLLLVQLPLLLFFFLNAALAASLWVRRLGLLIAGLVVGVDRNIVIDATGGAVA